MTFPNPQPGPRPGGFRPGPPPGGPRPPQTQLTGLHVPAPGGLTPLGEGEDTGHPAVDAVLRSLANAARLAPAEQLAEFEAAHQVLQETLASIDR
ncbi:MULTISPECIES: hypothetical protein [Actinoplanes]|uniref:hypothetical protein n=1 Tax=Actinoplanes TaxID=1865 RepID=UPI0005F2A768|nr:MULTISPECIES: hypothetical protein [Actinoplanes]GLX99627.1 hypothetical protein Acsp01_00070 [Actinoplanes sp. NBRC 101535]